MTAGLASELLALLRFILSLGNDCSTTVHALNPRARRQHARTTSPRTRKPAEMWPQQIGEAKEIEAERPAEIERAEVISLTLPRPRRQSVPSPRPAQPGSKLLRLNPCAARRGIRRENPGRQIHPGPRGAKTFPRFRSGRSGRARIFAAARLRVSQLFIADGVVAEVEVPQQYRSGNS